MSDKPPTYEASVRGAGFFGEVGIIAHSLLELGEGVLLEREPSNPADSNAIIVKSPTGHSIGYIERDVAAQMSLWLDQGWVFNSLCIRKPIVTHHRGGYRMRVALVRCIPIQPIKLGKFTTKKVGEFA